MAEKIELVIKIPKYYLTHPQDYTCLAECVRRGTPLSKNVEQAINRLHKHSLNGVVAMDYVEIVLKDVFEEVNAEDEESDSK